jgi:hypothetical protein
LLKAALAYAGHGLRVFPLYGVVDSRCACGDQGCANAGKHPLTRHGLKDATTDEEAIRAWWERWSEANIGAVPGPEFVVVDVDPRGGGFDSLAQLQKQNGDLPATLVAETGEYEVNGKLVRGLHLWFRVPKGREVTAARLAAGIDLKGARGYVVMPPSRHASGVEYRWRG